MFKLLKKFLNSDTKSIIKYEKKLQDFQDEFQKKLDSLSDEELNECIHLFFHQKNSHNNSSQFTFKNIQSNIDSHGLPLMLASQCCQRRYHVPHKIQLVAALLILDNHAVQMNTGEGKTLVIMLAAFTRAMMGHSVKVVTSNDYLAERDAHLYNQIYPYSIVKAAFNFAAVNADDKKRKQEIHNPELFKIMYSSPTELAFDYLRSNGVFHNSDCYVKDSNAWQWFDCVIIDEADSVLIDQATQEYILTEQDIDALSFQDDLVILGQVNDLLNSGLLIPSKYDQEEQMSKLARMHKLANASPEHLKTMGKSSGDYYFDKDLNKVNLFESGLDKIDEWAVQTQLTSATIPFHTTENYPHYIRLLNNRLLAEYALIKGEDYIIQDNQIVIIDRHTGRKMPMSRWKDGIHQAVEIKEGVPVQADAKTVDGIEYQTFFNLFKNKAGLSGTLMYEAEELRAVYNMPTVVLPPHRSLKRIDRAPVLFFNKQAKYDFLQRALLKKHKQGRPILICTPSIDISDEIAQVIQEIGLPFNRLDAKNHEYEAEIIAQAGQAGRITLASNMAGRGTDIKLGSETIEKNGGLLVISVEYSLSKRADAQIKGRAGRQGEQGESWTLVSFDDMLIQKFVPKHKSEYFYNIYLRQAGFNVNSNPIESDGLWDKLFNKTQDAIESFDRENRKRLTETGELLQQQRTLNYSLRQSIRELDSVSLRTQLPEWIKQYLGFKFVPSFKDEDEDVLPATSLLDFAKQTCRETRYQPFIYALAQKQQDPLTDVDFLAATIKIWEQRVASIDLIEGREQFVPEVLKFKSIQYFKNIWCAHLETLQDLRKSSKLVRFAGKQPVQELKHRMNTNFMTLHHETINDVLARLALDTDWVDTFLHIDAQEQHSTITIMRENFLQAADEKIFCVSN